MHKHRKKWSINGAILAAFCLLVYHPLVTEKLANPDTLVNGLYYKDQYNWEDALGRWGLRFLAMAKGYTMQPWLVAGVSLLLAVLCALLICKLLGLRPGWAVLLGGGLLLASPNLADALTYYYCADAYLLALLLNVGAIWYAHTGKSKAAWVLPAVAVALGYSLYQSYISVAMTLSLLLVVFALLDESQTLREVGLKTARYAVAGAGGTGLYLAVTKLMQAVGYCALTEDRGFSGMGKISLSALPRCYAEFVYYFIGNRLQKNSWMNRHILNGLVLLTLAAALVLLALFAWKKMGLLRPALALVCAALLPVALFAMLIAAPQVDLYGPTGILTVPAMQLVYLFWLAALTKLPLPRRPVQLFAGALGGALLWVLVSYVGVFQTCMELNLAAMQTVSTDILCELEGDQTLLVGGTMNLGHRQLYSIVEGTVAPYGMVWPENSISQQCWRGFFAEYLNYGTAVASPEEVAAVTQSDAYKAMPIYPAEGSICPMGEYLVVRLSE